MAINTRAGLYPAADRAFPTAEATATGTTTTATMADSRLGACEVCAKRAARYCCPKCEVKTCCLACVKIHKRELNCDGVRNRTKFIPLRRMTDRDFISDYYFLEECTRYTEDRKFDKLKRFTRYKKELPLHLQKLRKSAQQRKTNLLFLLQHFTRHMENTTYLNWKQNRLYWRIEWRFVNALTSDQQLVRYADTLCDEELTLGALVVKYLTDAMSYKELAYYQSAGLGKVKLLLRAERKATKQPRYHLLDVYTTLRENLANKTIIEYPIVCVTYDLPAGFDIIDSDEEECKGEKSRSVQRREIDVEKPPTKRQKQRLANQTANLLFPKEEPSNSQNSDKEDDRSESEDTGDKNLDDVNLPATYIGEDEDCFSNFNDDGVDGRDDKILGYA